MRDVTASFKPKLGYVLFPDLFVSHENGNLPRRNREKSSKNVAYSKAPAFGTRSIRNGYVFEQKS